MIHTDTADFSCTSRSKAPIYTSDPPHRFPATITLARHFAFLSSGIASVKTNFYFTALLVRPDRRLPCKQNFPFQQLTHDHQHKRIPRPQNSGHVSTNHGGDQLKGVGFGNSVRVLGFCESLRYLRNGCSSFHRMSDDWIVIAYEPEASFSVKPRH